MKQENKQKINRNNRLDIRVSSEEKALIKNYCETNHISITDLALTAIYNEMKLKSLETEVQNHFHDNSFYNYAVAHSANSPTIKKLIKSFNEGAYNHD